MTATTSLLVIGAGPYALSAAGFAREHGLDTVVVGRPMGFWRDNMPSGMFLRSGPDWHLDASGIHTLEAYLEERAILPGDVDPLPVTLFLDYAEWFAQAKGIKPLDDLVTDLTKPNGRFEAALESGERIAAEAVVAAPGIRHFTNVPAWAGSLPVGRSTPATWSASRTWMALACWSWVAARVPMSGRRCWPSTAPSGLISSTVTTSHGSSG